MFESSVGVVGHSLNLERIYELIVVVVRWYPDKRMDETARHTLMLGTNVRGIQELKGHHAKNNL